MEIETSGEYLLTETTLKEFLEATSDIYYILDDDYRIHYYNESAWNEFAMGNSADHLLDKDQTVGKSIIDLFSGEETKEIWNEIYNFVLQDRTQIRIPFNCHSEDTLRDGVLNITFFKSKITNLEKAIVVQSIIYKSRNVPKIPIYGMAAGRFPDYPILTICSFCKLVNYENDWILGSEYYNKGGDDKVNISHGVCPNCLKDIKLELS